MRITTTGVAPADDELAADGIGGGEGAARVCGLNWEGGAHGEGPGGAKLWRRRLDVGPGVWAAEDDTRMTGRLTGGRVRAYGEGGRKTVALGLGRALLGRAIGLARENGPRSKQIQTIRFSFLSSQFFSNLNRIQTKFHQFAFYSFPNFRYMSWAVTVRLGGCDMSA